MSSPHPDSFRTLSTLEGPQGALGYFSLPAVQAAGVGDVQRLPYSIRVLLEALLRNENGREITRDHIERLATYDPTRSEATELPFLPARVLLQDFTGVPAVVDLAAMRSAMQRLGGDPQRINPVCPVDLVIDHSVQVDHFASPEALSRNAQLEFQRNRERYEFLRWGQAAFDRFRVVPPASGICHQVNLEFLASVAQTRTADGRSLVFPDSLVGTDSHTPMVNGLGVVGWGVGGIEAEAVMLGQPLYMLTPAVVGFELTGSLPEGATATDLVLTVVQMLRAHGVVGKFVEFFGPGLGSMTVPDRATIANMAPEYGATMGFFPVDEQSLRYMRQSGRSEELIALVEQYYRAQGLFRTEDAPTPRFESVLHLDLSTVHSSLAGPNRPQDRILLPEMKQEFRAAFDRPRDARGFAVPEERRALAPEVESPDGERFALPHGSVVIAAITSCTNTSNPAVMIAAGLLARKAASLGLKRKPWVKSSLAPGSKVVTRYLERTGLLPDLEALGFHVVGYGCTTCIGNSGPLPPHIAQAVDEHGLVAAAVLSGNRNFEGRVSPRVRASYLASPPLVVAYALAGTVDVDLTSEPLGHDAEGQPVFLKDVWPSSAEIQERLSAAQDPAVFRAEYEGIERSNEDFNAIPVGEGALYEWQDASTYIQEPPFFVGMGREPEAIRAIEGARVLVSVGDSTTTDHISPAGAIPADSPAARYLIERGVESRDFNSFGSRRGNDRVMTRGTFGNIRLRNRMAPGTEGGYTTHLPTGEVVSIFEAAGRYQAAGTPTIVLGGRDYGMGSSRDWAAKGTVLLGVAAVIAESYERIHRSNLVGMGVLPLEYEPGQTAASLGLTGQETFDLPLGDDVKPGQRLTVWATRPDGTQLEFGVRCRLDSAVDVEYYRNGGILQTVLRRFLKEA